MQKKKDMVCAQTIMLTAVKYMEFNGEQAVKLSFQV